MASLDTTRVRALLDEHKAYIARTQPPEASSFMGDLPELGAMAVGNLATGVHGLAEYAGTQFDWEDVRQHSAEARQAINDFNREHFEQLSPETQAAMQKEYATWGEDAAWRDPRSVAASALVNSAYILPTILTGGLAAGGGTLAARVAGTIGLATEGALSAGATYSTLAGEIEKIPDAKLLTESPRYAELRESMSEREARLAFTDEVAGATFPLVFGATMGGGVLGGRAARVLTGKLPGARTGTGRLASAGRGAAEEFGQEAVQSGGESVLGNVAAQAYDTQRLATDDMLESIIGGGVAGGALGGAGGFAFRNRPWQPEAPASASQDLTQSRTTPSTEGVADALRARSTRPRRPPQQLELDLQGGEAGPRPPEQPGQLELDLRGGEVGALPADRRQLDLFGPAPVEVAQAQEARAPRQPDMFPGQLEMFGQQPEEAMPTGPEPRITQGVSPTGGALQQALDEAGLGAQPTTMQYELDQPADVNRAYVQPGPALPPATQMPLGLDMPPQPGGVQPALEAFPQRLTRAPRMDQRLSDLGARVALSPREMEDVGAEMVAAEDRAVEPELRRQRREAYELDLMRRARENLGLETTAPVDRAEQRPRYTADPAGPWPKSDIGRATWDVYSDVYAKTPARGGWAEMAVRQLDKLDRSEQVGQMLDKARAATSDQEERFWRETLARSFGITNIPESKAAERRRRKREPTTAEEVVRGSKRRETLARKASEAPRVRPGSDVGKVTSLLVDAPGGRTLVTAMEGSNVASAGGERSDRGARTLAETDPELYRDIGQILLAAYYYAYNQLQIVEVKLASADALNISPTELRRLQKRRLRLRSRHRRLADTLFEPATRRKGRTRTQMAAELPDADQRDASEAAGWTTLQGSNYPQRAANYTAAALLRASRDLDDITGGLATSIEVAAGRVWLSEGRAKDKWGAVRRELASARDYTERNLADSIVQLSDLLDTLPEEVRASYSSTVVVAVGNTRRRTWTADQMMDLAYGRNRSKVHYDEVPKLIKDLSYRASGLDVEVSWQDPKKPYEGQLTITRYDVLGPESLSGTLLARAAAEQAQTDRGQMAQDRREQIREAARRRKRKQLDEETLLQTLTALSDVDFAHAGPPEEVTAAAAEPSTAPEAPVLSEEEGARIKQQLKDRADVEETVEARDAKAKVVKKKRAARKQPVEPTQPPEEMTPPQEPEDTPATQDTPDAQVRAELREAIAAYERYRETDDYDDFSTLMRELDKLGLTLAEMEELYNGYQQTGAAPVQPGDAAPTPVPGGDGTDRPRAAVTTTATSVGGRRKPRSLTVVGAELQPQPDVDRLAGDPLADRVFPHQHEAASLALDAHARGRKGFMLADGVGVGKTRTLLAVAEKLRQQTDKPILILTQSQKIIDQWKRDDFKAMGLDPNNFILATYTGLEGRAGRPAKVRPDVDYGAIIYDEAHVLKNVKNVRDEDGKLKSSQGRAGRQLKGDFKLFSTATPLDVPEGLAYFAEVLSDQPREAVYRDLGFRLVELPNGDLKPVPLGGNINSRTLEQDEVLDKMAAYRDRMISEGVFIRRYLPFYGPLRTVEVTPSLEIIEESQRLDRLYEEAGKSMRGARRTGGAYWAEAVKAPQVAEIVLERARAGRQVFVVVETINDQKPSVIDKTYPGAREVIQRTLEKAGIKVGVAATIAKGQDGAPGANSDQKKQRLARRFNNGELQVLIGTAAGMGTGINLDDQVGDAPRTIVFAGPLWQGDLLDQTLGRVSRLMTASEAEAVFVLWEGDSILQERFKGTTQQNKIRALEAIRGGKVDVDVALGLSEDVRVSAPSVATPQPPAAPAATRRQRAPQGGTTDGDVESIAFDPSFSPPKRLPDKQNTKRLRELGQVMQGVVSGWETVEDLLDVLERSMHRSDPRRVLLKTLKRSGIKPIIEVKELEGNKLGTYRSDWQSNSTHAWVEGGRIQVSPKLWDDLPKMQHVILHELTHAVLSTRLQTDPEYVGHMAELYNRAIKAPQTTKQAYWTRDVNEFVAEAMSNPEFQMELMAIPADTKGFSSRYGLKRLKSLWDRFVDWSTKTLNMNRTPATMSMLSEVMMAVTAGAQTPEAQARPVRKSTREAARRIMKYRHTDVQEMWSRIENGQSIDSELMPYMDFESAKASGDTGSVIEALAHRGKWAAKDVWARTKEVGLGALNLRQIGDIYGNMFEGATNWLQEYVDLQGRRAMRTHELQRLPDHLANRWMALSQSNPDQHRAMTDLMLNDTVYGTWSDKKLDDPLNDHLTTPEQEAKWREHRAQYEALDTEAMALFHEVRRYFVDDWQRTTDLLKKNIRRAYDVDTHDTVKKAMEPPDLIGVTDRKTAMEAWRNQLYAALRPHVQKKGTTDPDVKAITDIIEAVEKTHRVARLQGPYFPLRRYGDYVVHASRSYPQDVRDADALEALRTRLWATDPGIEVVIPMDQRNADGGGTAVITEQWFSSHDTLYDAEQQRLALEADARWKNTTMEVGRKQDLTMQTEGLTSRLLNRLEESGKLNQAQFNALKAVFIEFMPDTSIRKAELKRKGTAGYSRDALRSFASHATASSYHQAQLEYGSRMKEALVEMGKAARRAQRTNEGRQIDMQQVVHELEKRDSLSAVAPWERRGEALVNVLNNTGFTWYLANASYLLINLTQPWAIGLPWLAARYGTTKASAVMSGMLPAVSRDMARGGKDDIKKYILRQFSATELVDPAFSITQLVDESTMFKPNERANVQSMLNELSERGLIQLTFAGDLRGYVAGHGGTGFTATMGKIMDGVRALPQRVEITNRQLMALSAYRLALDSGLDHKAAVEAAVEAVWQTQFDYSAANKPRWFQAQALRPVLLFKQHAQNMYVLLIKSTYDMLRHEDKATRKVAGRQLAGILAMHGLLAGALGMVFEPVKYAIVMLGLLFGDDDEPFDYEVWVRQGLADMFGKEAGEVLARGLPRAAGVDLSSRIQLGNMLVLDNGTTAEGRQYVQEMLYNLGGPLVAMVGNAAEGMKDVREGATLRGVERMMPKAARDIIQSWRFGTEGITDSRGNVIRATKHMDPWELFVKGVGFQPSETAELYEARNAALGMKGHAQRRRQTLIERYRRADAAERRELWRDEISAFNRRHPKFKLTRGALQRSLQAKRKRERQADRDSGVAVERKYRRLLEEARFANL